MKLFQWTVLLASLCTALSAELIRPDDPRLAFRGVGYPQVEREEAELLRFDPSLLVDAKAWTHGFNPAKARTTTGASIVFTAKTPAFTMHFESGKNSRFGIFQNKVLSSIERLDAEGRLRIEALDGADWVSYRVVFRIWQNPLFKGMQLARTGAFGETPGAPVSQVCAALGDSITHVRGQDIGHQTWAWQVADRLGMEFLNLAVGGSHANPYRAQAIADPPSVDLVTIPWGYNDWVYRGKTPETYAGDMAAAMDVIRAQHPEVLMVILGLRNTRTEGSKRKGDQFSAQDFRDAAEALVVRRRSDGKRIQIIDTSVMVDEEADLCDAVHLSVAGAARLARNLSPVLKGLLKTVDLASNPRYREVLAGFDRLFGERGVARKR